MQCELCHLVIHYYLSYEGQRFITLLKPAVIHSGFYHCEIPPRQHNPPLSSKRSTKWDCKKAIPEQIGAPLYIITIQFNSQLALPRLSYWLFFLGFRLFICFWIMSITRCRCSNTCKRKKKISIFISFHSLLGVNSKKS